MSSQTPNINLTLPTGLEKVSRQIINDNNTKIDTAIGALNSNINTLLTTKAEIFATGSITANSSAVIEVGRGRIYVLVCGGAYATGSMYIIFGWTAGSGRVQTVKANSAVTISIDSERKVTIASTEGISYSFVDIGAFT